MDEMKMGRLKTECKKCHNFVIDILPEGYCHICWDAIQDEALLKNIIQTKLPEGLVAFWEDSISYISKKKDRAYFKIPPEQKSRILDDIKYRIIIKEVGA